MSLRARFVLAAAYLLTAVVLALEVPLALNVEGRIESEFRANVLGRGAVLAARLADPVAEANAPPRPRAVPQRVAVIVRSTLRVREERILVTDSRGRVLADTTGTAEIGARYATAERPELLAALRGEIDSRERASERDAWGGHPARHASARRPGARRRSRPPVRSDGSRGCSRPRELASARSDRPRGHRRRPRACVDPRPLAGRSRDPGRARR